MLSLRTTLGFTAVLLLVGCPKNAARRDQLLQRASFDLDCPQDQLELTPLGEIPGTMGIIGSYGVSGCGQRATYVLADRVWVANNPAIEAE